MRRPNALTFLFGNPAVFLLLAILAVVLLYQWWFEDASGAAALVAAAAAGGASKAHGRLEDYYAWKREWQVMSGAAPTAGRMFISYRALRIAAGSAAWLAFAFLSMGAYPDQNTRFAAVWFWLVTAVAVVGVIVQWWRKRPRKSEPLQDVPVTVCLAVPRKAATLREAYTALPKYCLGLFRRIAPPAEITASGATIGNRQRR